MPSAGYKLKRNFRKTAEPVAEKPLVNKLRFVIHKHLASQLHYDLRLELGGALVSWALPKGPSMDTRVKRLAIRVEDHPYHYRNFEGVIPEGSYGAGSVIVWDEGWYAPADGDAATKSEQEKQLLHNLKQGRIIVVVHGKKIKGKFALIHIKKKNTGKEWLLIKEKDGYETTSDITRKTKSVLSDRSVEQVMKTEFRPEKKRSVTLVTRNRLKGGVQQHPDWPELLKKAVRKKMPTGASPMLCTLTRDVPDNTDYLYEIKWDGYRIIGLSDGKTVKLRSRNGLDYSARYPVVVNALKAINHQFILDGEMVVFNEAGRPDFDALQRYHGQGTGICYCVFDILWIDGYDLKTLPLEDRKYILKSLIDTSASIRYSDSFADGRQLYALMQQQNMEGVVAKKRNSSYHEGERKNDWLKNLRISARNS